MCKTDYTGGSKWRGVLGTGLMTVALAFGVEVQSGELEPLRVVSVSDSPPCDSGRGPGGFIHYLENRYAVDVECINIKDGDSELEALENCDVVLFHAQDPVTREAALDPLRAYARSGRPIVALRAAIHGFEGYHGFGSETLGGDFSGRYERGPTARTAVTARGREHPVFDGVGPIRSRHGLYKIESLAEDSEVLMIGGTPDSSRQPVVWIREQEGKRLFYTSLGGFRDFEADSFKRLIANALFWAAGREPEREPLPDLPQWERKRGEISMPVRLREQRREDIENEWRERVDTRELQIERTAIVVSNMRDAHWCPSAAARVDALAERVNKVISVAREAGMLIVHVPSNTPGFYEKHPARRRIEELAGRTMEGAYPVDPYPMRSLDIPPLPDDLSNQDCPDENKPYPAWTRQHSAIDIYKTDVISDVGRQIYSYLITSGIDTLMYVGVHANTTLLERSFGMVPMSRWGMDCILVRDLTDIMCTPEISSHLSHEAALKRVVQHLEKHVAPSATSEDLIDALSRAIGVIDK